MLLGIALIGGGFAVGVVIGRWWALAAPLALGIYVYVTAEASRFGHSDIPWSVVALAYGLWSAGGVSAGVLARRSARRFANLS